jgi:hypothetical protein
VANYLNLSSYSIHFNPLEVDSKKEVSKVSKEILSLAPATSENLFVNTNSPVVTEQNVIPNNPTITKVNTVAPTVIPTTEKVSAYTPAVESATTTTSAVQTPITYNISRQVATNQAGFGVNLSSEAQKSINSLNVNAMPYNKNVKTEEVMNGKIFLSEMKTQEELKNIFVVPNLIKTQETLATNLDSKKRSEGFSFNRGNNEKQSKQKNSLNVSI